MGEVSTIGLDIAKSVFQVHGVDAVMRKRIGRLAALGMSYVPVQERSTSGFSSQPSDGEEAIMRYRLKSIAAPPIALGGLPNKMQVEVDSDIGVSVKTVGELRKATAWPENLAISTPERPGPKAKYGKNNRQEPILLVL